MESLHPLILRIIAGLALIYFGLGLFNINWLLRIRVLAALSCGALLVTALGWSMVRPTDPIGAVTLFNGEITTPAALLLVVLAIAASVAATVVCWPAGRFLGPIAAPAGIGIFALISGTLRQVLLTNSTLADRNELYAFLRWEMLFWLGLCTAGYLASIATSQLIGPKASVNINDTMKTRNSIEKWGNLLAAVIVAGVIIHFTIGIFAQDIRQVDEKLGYVIGQPGGRQIVFGVFVSVGLAAFVVKHFMKVHYTPVIVGAAALYFISFTRFIDSDLLQYMVKTWPIDFFPNSLYAILPVEFVSFSILGAISGYWMSVHFKTSHLPVMSDNPE